MCDRVVRSTEELFANEEDGSSRHECQEDRGGGFFSSSKGVADHIDRLKAQRKARHEGFLHRQTPDLQMGPWSILASQKPFYGLPAHFFWASRKW